MMPDMVSDPVAGGAQEGRGSARRDQLIDLTISLIAERGLAGTTLSRIAAAAGVTNAAVLYFFKTKDAVIQAACERAVALTVAAIQDAVEQAPSPRAAIDAYVRALVKHLSAHPEHVSVLVEMGRSGGAGEERRWPPVAQLIEAAQRDGDIRPLDARTASISLLGAVDGMFAEALTDPSYDLAAATDTVLELFDRAVR